MTQRICNLDHFIEYVIGLIRLWLDGKEPRLKLKRDLIISLGYLEGYKAIRSLENICSTIDSEGCRPLIFYPLSAEHVGLGEGLLRNLFEKNINKDLDYNILEAVLIVPEKLLPMFSNLLLELGLTIKAIKIPSKKRRQLEKKVRPFCKSGTRFKPSGLLVLRTIK